MSKSLLNNKRKTASEMGIDVKGLNETQIDKAIEAKAEHLPAPQDDQYWGEVEGREFHSEEEMNKAIEEAGLIVVNTDFSNMKLGQGRPVDPTSVRQQKITQRIAAGTIGQRGRPIVPGSDRQLRIEAMEAKAATGAPIKRGRPKDPNSQAAMDEAKKVVSRLQVWAARNNYIITGKDAKGQLIARINKDMTPAQLAAHNEKTWAELNKHESIEAEIAPDEHEAVSEMAALAETVVE